MSDHLIAEANRHARALGSWAHTCIHHNDKQRTECPVCLVASLTAERDQLRSDCENETKWAAHYLAQSIADKARAERAEAELATERARLDYLLQWDVTFHDRADIDAELSYGQRKKSTPTLP